MVRRWIWALRGGEPILPRVALSAVGRRRSRILPWDALATVAAPNLPRAAPFNLAVTTPALRCVPTVGRHNHLETDGKGANGVRQRATAAEYANAGTGHPIGPCVQHSS